MSSYSLSVSTVTATLADIRDGEDIPVSSDTALYFWARLEESLVFVGATCRMVVAECFRCQCEVFIDMTGHRYAECPHCGKLATIEKYRNTLKRISDHKVTVTLYDTSGYIIGKTVEPISKTTSYPAIRGAIFRYNMKEQLTGQYLLQHVSEDSAVSVVYVEVVTWNENHGLVREDLPHMICGNTIDEIPHFDRRAADCSATTPAVMFEVYNTKDEHIVSAIECDAYKVATLMKKSEFFQKLVEKSGAGVAARQLTIKDVDPGLFRRLVDFMVYDRFVHLMTKEGPTLRQCCRDMLKLANQFLCNELAERCARCIVKASSKESIFGDIHLLATHYNEPNKLEVIREMAPFIKKLQPSSDKKKQLEKIYKELSADVIVTLIDALSDSTA